MTKAQVSGSDFLFQIGTGWRNVQEIMRVLITTVTAGGGHLAAAQALEEGWRAERPGDEIERLDLLKFFSPLHRRIYAQGYLQVADKAPEVWGLVFKRTDNPRLAQKLSRIKRVLPSASRSRYTRYLAEFKPDIVLCTHYLPLEGLNRMRQAKLGNRSAAQAVRTQPNRSSRRGPAGAFDPVVVTVVTDFEAHALWMDSCVDLYCVAAEQTKARLVARGVDPAKVLPTGIPISGKFGLEVDRKAVRKQLGLRDDLPLVLVLSGGFGMGPVAEIVGAVDGAANDFQVVVVTGRNVDLRRELAIRDHKHPTHVLGFVTNMHELMWTADLVVSKPGGLTSSEALAAGKPLFIINPIPGQEAANSDFLLEHGAAAKANRVEDLPYRIEQLVGSKKLQEMGRAARRLGRPDAAREICRESVKIADTKTLSENRPMPA